MTLDDVISKTMELLQTMGYTDNTWKCAFRNGRFREIRRYYEESKTTMFSIELTKEYMSSLQEHYERGERSYSSFAHLRKKAMWLIEVYETGNLVWKMPNKSKVTINSYFTGIRQQHLDSKDGVLSSNNLAGQKSTILHFLGYLQRENGYSDLSSLSRKDVHGFIQFKSRDYNSGMDNVLYSLRSFLVYLHEQNIIQDDLAAAVYKPAQKRRRVLSGFSREEVDKILAQADQTTATGKRDYAIMLLGKNTGLRIGDILALQLSDIDWRKKELTVIQKKTGRPLTLPLNNETESAIAKYILDGRPKHDCQNIFLKNRAPCGPLAPQTVVTFFRDYRLAAGIEQTPYGGKSFHGLRRSIAHWMLESDIPLTTISQILGHGQINSTTPYLSYDNENLRHCALALTGLECKKEGLL